MEAWAGGLRRKQHECEISLGLEKCSEEYTPDRSWATP